jgi:hypothetical protein
MILNSIQILNKTFGQCSLGLARFTNVIFMLALPFVFIKYLKKSKNEGEQVRQNKESLRILFLLNDLKRK